MGGEFGTWSEWNHEGSLDWHLLDYPAHAGIKQWVRDLNRIYGQEKALHETDLDARGFKWVVPNDSDQSVLAFLRQEKASSQPVLVACNFTPKPRFGYRIGVPQGGFWRELLNGDAQVYGGTGLGNEGGVEARENGSHGFPYSLEVTLPPLAVLFLQSL
jgi:1,4-alpha-glucan branching enzyme